MSNVQMSGILPDTTVTSASRNNNFSLLNNATNSSAFDKCNCDSYVAWINCQLGDHSSVSTKAFRLHTVQQSCDSTPVKDLSRDLRNGVVLARLAEKLSGESLARVHPHPVTRQQMLTNVDEVLKFAYRWRIKMHPVLSTEVVDGNIRATLRLVLAMAAHFRPASVVRQLGSNSHQTSHFSEPNVTFLPPKSLPSSTPKSSGYVSESNSFASFTPSPPVTPSRSTTLSSISQQTTQKLLRYKAVRSPRTAASITTPPHHILTPPSTETNDSINRSPSAHFDTETDEGALSRGDSQFSSPVSHDVQTSSHGATSTCSLDSASGKQAVLDEQDVVSLQSEIANAKKSLLLLQHMLFEQEGDGENGDSKGDGGVGGRESDNAVANFAAISAVFSGSNQEQQPQRQQGESGNVISNNNHTQEVLQLRAQICELNLTMQELSVEKHELECRVVDRDRQIADLVASLTERDRLIDHLQDKVHSLISEGKREVAELRKEFATSVTSPTGNEGSTGHFYTKKGALLNGKTNNNGHYKVKPESEGTRYNSYGGCRIYYFNSDGAGPFCMFASKPLQSLCLRDIRTIFTRFGRSYRFFFVPVEELERLQNATIDSTSTLPVDDSMATVELASDNDFLPGLNDQVYCKLEEVV